MEIKLLLLNCNMPLDNNMFDIAYYHPSNFEGYIEEFNSTLKFYELSKGVANYNCFYYGINQCSSNIVRSNSSYLAELTFVEKVPKELEIDIFWLEFNDRFLGKYIVDSTISGNKVHLSLVENIGIEYRIQS